MKYFGTDGVRGRANENLTVEMALKIGQYIGWYFSKQKNHKIVIGRDSRLSSKMFESALVAGISSSGCDVFLLGLCSTPCVAHVIVQENFACGAMISASHNPFYDNGIKLFNFQGKKMDNDILKNIEDYIDGKTEVLKVYDDKIGRVINFKEGVVLYESWLKQIIQRDFSQFNIALDLANGSACRSAAHVLRDLNANLKVIHSTPNGQNINTKCGSTHLKSLQELMKTGIYDIGFAFDGDADRLICVNHQGEVIDGDGYLYVLAKYLKKQNKLKDNVVVTTIMSNIGLYKALEKEDIAYTQTSVGDKYVFECMDANDYSLGGEQSGHIIFKEYGNTGDGLLSALLLLKVLHDEQQSLQQLTSDLFVYPQLLQNIRVYDKTATLENIGLKRLIKKISQDLGNEGRILVRESGTEPLIRVMVEAKTQELCEKYVYQVIDYIKENRF